MRLISLLFTATLVATPARAQQQPASSAVHQKPQTGDNRIVTNDQPSRTNDQSPTTNAQAPTTNDHFELPVSLDRIKEGLQQTPALSLTTVDVRPTFRVQILERQK